MKNKFNRYFYTVLLFLSCLGMSVAGLVLMTTRGEEYKDQPALAAFAINHIEQSLKGPLPEVAQEEGTEAESDGEESDEEEDESEDEIEEAIREKAKELEDDAAKDDAEEDDFDKRMAQLDEQIRELKEKKHGKKRSGTGRDESEEYVDEDDPDTSEEELKYDFIEVKDDYFDDALFIGDSRQQDFAKYSGMDNITVYADRGYQIYDTATKAITDPAVGKLTVYDGLAANQHRFKKVYIMFGVNEMSGGADQSEMSKYYYRLIHEIKRMQPDAIIYLESVFHVTKTLSDARPVFSNEKINEKNRMLKKVAKDEGIVFLDLNEIPEFTNADGALVPEATDDGMHLHNGYILLIKDYLYKHALEYKGGEDKYPYVELSTVQQQLKDKYDELKPKRTPEEEEERIRRQQEEQERQEQERIQKEKDNVMVDTEVGF